MYTLYSSSLLELRCRPLGKQHHRPIKHFSVNHCLSSIMFIPPNVCVKSYTIPPWVFLQLEHCYTLHVMTLYSPSYLTQAKTLKNRQLSHVFMHFIFLAITWLHLGLDPFIFFLILKFKFIDFGKTKFKFIDFEKTKFKFIDFEKTKFKYKIHEKFVSGFKFNPTYQLPVYSPVSPVISPLY